VPRVSSPSVLSTLHRLLLVPQAEIRLSHARKRLQPRRKHLPHLPRGLDVCNGGVDVRGGRQDAPHVAQARQPLQARVRRSPKRPLEHLALGSRRCERTEKRIARGCRGHDAWSQAVQVQRIVRAGGDGGRFPVCESKDLCVRIEPFPGFLFRGGREPAPRSGGPVHDEVRRWNLFVRGRVRMCPVRERETLKVQRGRSGSWSRVSCGHAREWAGAHRTSARGPGCGSWRVRHAVDTSARSSGARARRHTSICRTQPWG